jgi:plasmid stabilization system protein ParE
MNIVYAPRALRDLEYIERYLFERSPSGALNVLGTIKSSIDSRNGRNVDGAGHRRLPVLRYPYAIFYRIADYELINLHVRHTSRRSIDPAADLTE